MSKIHEFQIPLNTYQEAITLLVSTQVKLPLTMEWLNNQSQLQWKSLKLLIKNRK